MLQQNESFCLAEVIMTGQPYPNLTLFGPCGNRKYLNAAERKRFLDTAQALPPLQRSFCLMLAWSGARISEILALTPAAIDIDSGVASIQTLKRRRRGVVRQVPIPREVLDELDHEFHLRDVDLANERLGRSAARLRGGASRESWREPGFPECRRCPRG